ncbi:NAD(P)/FAD-dependent oxidoreductase [Subtercola frigoramans]|uniref:NAD/FAD-dependent oxidoreductase n=1 Tax=Subtercola frigoramans TaxID=120298 RepID=A0ABS2L9D8_9MICO|nr:FAD-dependent oxidoreductase [Subtercola frigoramans]MBM7473684.1 putative NAD/FAD-dependent oxidoreductase [Subtercola frigoramans]
MTSPSPSPSVLVVGSGIAGLACARVLHDSGVAVRVVDRGRVVGGRLATKRVDDRPVDIGARYFTVPDSSLPGEYGFAAVVEDWVARGLARPWTSTFDVVAPDGSRERKEGPMRFAAPAGTRSLAVDLADRLRADGVTLELEHEVSGVSDQGEVSGIRYDAVVLAMPDPQARRLVAPGSSVALALQGPEEWLPTLAVVATWPERLWPAELHGAFVNGSATLAFVADDGDRRGDGAAVLVAHTTPECARQYLEEPSAAIAPVVEALGAFLGTAERPSQASVHRWSFALPATQHDSNHLLRGAIGVCGDAWGERSAVSTAWSSGASLGGAIAATLV